MAKYTFVCPKCNANKKLYTSDSSLSVRCNCGAEMERQIPSINQSNVTEIIDPYLGVALQPDHDKLLKERKEEHFWRFEVPKLVNKYSVEHCLENGWLFMNDKGQLEIQTKPPSKR